MSLSLALHNTLPTVIIIFATAKRRCNNFPVRYTVSSETFLGIPINFQLAGVKGTLVLRHILSHRKRSGILNPFSLAAKCHCDIHKHPISHSIAEDPSSNASSRPPLRNLFVSVKPRRGVCENALFVRFHPILFARQFEDLFAKPAYFPSKLRKIR